MTQQKPNRAVFFSFEFHKDRQRWQSILGDAEKHCDFNLIDWSLPCAVHDEKWERAVKERIRKSAVVIVLLGEDTHNARGVEIELSLAGESKRPVVQLMPQGEKCGLVAKDKAVCPYEWTRINKMLHSPKAYAGNPANRGK